MLLMNFRFQTFLIISFKSFVLTESRAIMLYLIDSRAGTDCSLKSSDPQEMATIHQRLFFDCELFDGLTRLVVIEVVSYENLFLNTF